MVLLVHFTVLNREKMSKYLSLTGDFNSFHPVLLKFYTC